MSFQSPIWIHSKYCYNVKPNNKISFIFTNTFKYNKDLEFPNTTNDEMVNEIKNIAERIVIEGKGWFASPIQQDGFLRKVYHTFSRNEIFTYESGKTYIETWKLKNIWIFSNKFELEWTCIDNQTSENSIIPSDFLNFSEEYNTIDPPRTIVIQPVIEDDLLEEDDIPFESSDHDEKLSSRTLLKDKIKKTKVKIAIAQMKLSQLEKKYFRLYGFENDEISSSSGSNEESSENEE